jgi:hypothetical protein
MTRSPVSAETGANQRRRPTLGRRVGARSVGVRVEDRTVERDFDDTVRAAPRPAEVPRGEDVEDTVARGAVPPVVAEVLAEVVAEVPPALVEPPVPVARPLPVVVEPIVSEISVTPPAPVEPKPVFRVLFPDGAEVALDVTVYVGRKPSIPRIHAGQEPRLVTLASPGKELSATHLELKVVGGAVVASDMRSTNGTVVQLPGAAPRTLIRGESAVVVPGTRIDLGDGAVLDILPPPKAGTP